MRPSRLLFILIIATFLSIIYIHQQTLIFYLAYNNEQKKRILDELVDKNNILRYDTSAFSSLVYLGGKILNTYAEDFQTPQKIEIVKINSIDRTESAKTEKRTSVVFRIINRLTKSAEAKTLNP